MTVDLEIDLPAPTRGRDCELTITPLRLEPPAGVNAEHWTPARRAWFNAIQPVGQRGERVGEDASPAGLPGNSVVSEPTSLVLWAYADQIFWTPRLAPDISAMQLVRRSVEHFLQNRMRPDGQVSAYAWGDGIQSWDYLDANAGPLIAAWDYVESTGDVAWLADIIPLLERCADYLAARDMDGDGMVEAVQSGNRGDLVDPRRGCSWWDAIGSGHKDGYSNALIYRGWRCLADLEAKLGRKDRATRYTELADRLRVAYAPALMNEETGWLAWWRSADGQLHDTGSTMVNGMAIAYGLVEPHAGREILAKLRRAMSDADFKRYDLGVPPSILPIRKGDYLLPDHVMGSPKRDDGTDTVGVYMNCGLSPGFTSHFLTAHYVVGDAAPADKILSAMLGAASEGRIMQYGAQIAGEKLGTEFLTWDGKPAGMEGYLAENFCFLQAVLLRDAANRARFLRPMLQASPADRRR
jgi:hypothetical protein